jgi:predicted nucleic acid-binding protein
MDRRHPRYRSALERRDTGGRFRQASEITREQDPDKANEIEAWARQIATLYNVLPMDAETFRLWAKLMHRKTNTTHEDAMIAATARVHCMCPPPPVA